MIARSNQKYGFPNEVLVSYAKNAPMRIAEILSIFRQAEIHFQASISLQTMDETTLEIINRSNIKTDYYMELSNVFRKQDLPLSTELMIGLPGSTYESFRKELQFFFDLDIPVYGAHTQVLPNSPMGDPEYLEKFKIRTDDEGFIVSTFSAGEDEIQKSLILNNLYQWFVDFGFLKYFISYLQWDHGINCVEFLDELLDEILLNPDDFQSITLAINMKSPVIHSIDNHWDLFYQEIDDFSKKNFSLTDFEVPAMVLQMNKSLMLDPEGRYQLDIPLQHDYENYYLDHRDGKCSMNLVSYPPGSIKIDEKWINKIHQVRQNVFDNLRHRDFEIKTSLTRVKPYQLQ
jgi:hypothetical protein